MRWIMKGFSKSRGKRKSAKENGKANMGSGQKSSQILKGNILKTVKLRSQRVKMTKMTRMRLLL